MALWGFIVLCSDNGEPVFCSSSHWVVFIYGGLPWLITALGVVPGCFVPFVDEANEILMMFLIAISSIIFMVGLILIFATLGKKKKIRLANDIPVTKNPYTWFLSKIGKVVCGTTILVVGFGIFIMIALFTIGASSGNSSSRISSGSSSGSKTDNKTSNNSSGNKSPFKFYYCEYCGHKEMNLKLLLNGYCHRHPTDPNHAHHKLYEGSLKSEYYCKFCGHKEMTLEHLTNGFCDNHPNGRGKGHHQPAL